MIRRQRGTGVDQETVEEIIELPIGIKLTIEIVAMKENGCLANLHTIRISAISEYIFEFSLYRCVESGDMNSTIVINRSEEIRTRKVAELHHICGIGREPMLIGRLLRSGA